MVFLCLWRWRLATLGDCDLLTLQVEYTLKFDPLELSHSKHVLNRIGTKDLEFVFLGHFWHKNVK